MNNTNISPGENLIYIQQQKKRTFYVLGILCKLGVKYWFNNVMGDMMYGTYVHANASQTFRSYTNANKVELLCAA